MKKALLNIDYTYDFVAEDGALTCGEPGQVLHDYIVDLTKKFHHNGDHVAFLIDLHFENDTRHPESKLFPPHNIAGTAGRELYGELEELYQEIKDSEHVEYFDKTRYSAFTGTPLELKLRERQIDELHIVGVCTDICVISNALLIKAYLPEVEIRVDPSCSAGVTPLSHETALEAMRACQITILGDDQP